MFMWIRVFFGKFFMQTLTKWMFTYGFSICGGGEKSGDFLEWGFWRE